MADDASRVKTITDNLEETRKSMARVASNIAGLLQVGRATCDEVRAYNMWALALYNEGRGMLETMRQAGQQGLPALPPMPTMFPWRGMSGQDAWKIDCAGQPSSLSGAVKQVLRGPNEGTQFLSTNEIAIATNDPYLYNPENSPSFASLYNTQQARAAQAGLGIAPAIIIVIVGLSIMAIAAAVVAISKYLETKEIQESNTKQVKLQADAFANYTAARLACYADCTKGGKSAQECVDICKNLVDKPEIKTSFDAFNKWGTLQWVGFTVVAGIVAVIGVKIYQRHKAGKPILELPEFQDAA